MKKKVLGFMMCLCIMTGIMSGCGHEHLWADATCTEPKTCSVCGETEGDALEHAWVGATCTEPKTCSVCGETEGDALGHTWVDATCKEPKTCSVCGETEGDALGHIWIDETCINPKICSVCGETEGDIGDHTWIEATCLTPQICSVCGATEGETGAHNYNENGICVVCGQSREIELTLDNIGEYLTWTYEVIPNQRFYRKIDSPADNYADNYDVIVVTIAPKSDEYIFQNVCVGVANVYHTNFGDYVDEDYWFKQKWAIESWNGDFGFPRTTLDNEGNGTIGTEFCRVSSNLRSYLDGVIIIGVEGKCIRK